MQTLQGRQAYGRMIQLRIEEDLVAVERAAEDGPFMENALLMNDNSRAQSYSDGAWSGYGDSIMRRGFELGHPGRGHLLGRGVYIARGPATAAL